MDPRWRTVITTLSGLGTLVAIGWLRLDGQTTGALCLAVVGVCGGAAAKSGAEAVAKAKAAGITAEHVVQAARKAVELSRPRRAEDSAEHTDPRLRGRGSP